MIRLAKTLLTVALFLIYVPAAHAQDSGHNVSVRLIPEGHAYASSEITIAIEQSIAPGWHTYWKNPGDSGAAPRFKWRLPPGFELGELEWPVPHKLPFGGLLNYGYENNVILLQKIKTPETMPRGPLPITAEIDILVCKEICIPESGVYDVVLNASDSSILDSEAYFDNARALMPIDGGEGQYYEDGEFFVLEKPITWSQGVARYDYIPGDWGLVENTAQPEITEKDGILTIRQKRGQRAVKEINEMPGLLLWSMSNEGPFNAYAFTAKPHNDPPVDVNPFGNGSTKTQVQTEMPEGVTPPPDYSLVGILLSALLGGLILNLMPCVFPVLSIKALSLVKISEKEPALARLHGLAYTAGIILSFLVIASTLIALKAGGSKIGWGFQLQNPEIVTALAWLFFIIGLNLSGIFEIGGHLGNVGNKLTQGNTPTHSFFTGVLATLVATPCTAPFMAVAIGFALVQPTIINLSVFAALGFGLALPYLALSFIPPLQKMLPRPGAWMDSFKQLLAFPMYASAAWLVWVISQQSGSMGVFTALMGLVLIAFGIWLLRHMPASKTWRVIVRVLAVLSFLAAILMIPNGTHKEEMPFGEEWSPAKLSTLLEGNDPLFVEMTAAWCITCKVNHGVALDIDSTRRIFADHNVKYLIGDWTNQDPNITEYLNLFGRNGVPIYVYYGPKGPDGKRPEPVVLPQILTPGIVAKTVTGG